MVVTTSKLFLQRWEVLTPLCFLYASWAFHSFRQGPEAGEWRHPEHSFVCMELFIQHSCTEIQWAKGIWGITHKASATKIKRIWVIFEVTEWIRLVSLQRREGIHRQNLRTRAKDKQWSERPGNQNSVPSVKGDMIIKKKRSTARVWLKFLEPNHKKVEGDGIKSTLANWLGMEWGCNWRPWRIWG